MYIVLDMDERVITATPDLHLNQSTGYAATSEAKMIVDTDERNSLRPNIS